MTARKGDPGILARVDVTTAPDGSVTTVRPIWADVDRPDVMTWVVTSASVAQRFRLAALAGAVFPGATVGRDVNGKTYVLDTSVVSAGDADADLVRLGF